MLDALRETWNEWLGLDLRAEQLGFVHMALRGVVVFCFAILLSRVADRRLLGRSAGYDIMVLVVLGSVLSRAINGQARFAPTLGASAVLVLIHRLIGTLTFHSHFFSKAIKGNAQVLVRDGEVDETALRRNKITPDDLDENLRNHGNVGSVREVAEARLERNGVVSVVKEKSSGAPARRPAAPESNRGS